MSPRILAIGLSSAAFIFLSPIVFSCTSSRFFKDSITGTTKLESCIFGRVVSSRVEPTELEQWIIEHEGSYSPSWVFVTEHSTDILGNTIRGCSISPEIAGLMTGTFLGWFVQISSDQELSEFVKTMRTGTRGEQRKAVDAAVDRVFDYARTHSLQ